MTEHTVLGHCGRMGAGCDDKLAVTQSVERVLDGTLGQACFFGDHPETHCHWSPPLPRSAPKQKQVKKKSGMRIIVRDEIAHKNVEHVVVHRHSDTAARHGMR